MELRIPAQRREFQNLLEEAEKLGISLPKVYPNYIQVYDEYSGRYKAYQGRSMTDSKTLFLTTGIRLLLIPHLHGGSQGVNPREFIEKEKGNPKFDAQLYLRGIRTWWKFKELRITEKEQELCKWYDRAPDINQWGFVYTKNWVKVLQRFVAESALIDRLDRFIPADPISVEAQTRVPLGADCRNAKQVYSRAVSEGKLRWANSLGFEFPYVLTDSATIGNVGLSMSGLYFVAKDLASKPWQEQLVAFHERFCSEEGHEYALKQEKTLARQLGVEKKYQNWRDMIRGDAQRGRFV